MLEYQNFENEQQELLECYTNKKGITTYIFTWLNQFIQIHQRNLEQKDVFNINIQESIEYQSLNFELNKNSLIYSLLKSYPTQWICIILLKVGIMGIQLLNPFLINNIVELFDSPGLDFWQFMKTISLFSGWITAIYVQISILSFYQKQVQIKVQAALSSLLYHKLFSACLPLPSQAEIINLFQIDIPQITILFDCGVSLFLTPFQICGAIYIYFETVGLAASFGLIGMFIQVGISLIYGSIYSRLQNSIMTSRDNRISNMDELLKGILTIKQNCYYKFFFNRIKDKRYIEMSNIATQQKLSFIVKALFSIIPAGVMYFTMKIFDIFNLKSVLMVTQNYAQLIQSVNSIPNNLGQILMAQTSIKRYMDFISSQDVEQYLLPAQSIQILIKEGNFRWRNSKNPFQLKNINLQIEKGEFIVIVGKNGSGKSSLLYCLLGELEKINENSYINLEGSISVASQEPFLIQGTIKQNIIDQQNLEIDRYLEIIKSTQLLEDIIRMESGQNSEVGEDGQSLSGGQRKRIHLARTLYKDSDIYLLDCPFESLDHKTAKKLMDELYQINKKDNKTIILTCNDINQIKICDRIIHLDDGQIIYYGSLDQFKGKCESNDLDSLDLIENQQVQQDETIKESNQHLYNLIDKQQIIVIENEERTLGSLQLEIFKYLYQLFGKYQTFVVIMIFCVLGMICSTFYQLKLKSITEISNSNQSTLNQKAEALEQFLFVYPFFNILMALFTLFSGIFLTQKGITASMILHNNIINNLLKASVTEFYNVTLGSIIKNRMTNDLFQFDMNTPSLISQLFDNIFSFIALMLGCLFLSSALSFPILICYLILQTQYLLRYIRINLEIARLQAISKSPLLNTLTQTHQGILFNRHCKEAQKQVSIFFEQFNIYTQNSICSAALSSWFIQITCLLMLIMYVFILIVNYIYKINNKESATISMYLAVSLGEKFTSLTLTFQSFYSNNVYLERCLSLINNIAKEDLSNQQYSDFENPIDRRNSDFHFSDHDDSSSQIEMMTIKSVESIQELQQQFVLELNNVSLQYKNSTVLTDISFKLKQRQKIAILGRTGAGKTSLMHCITRLVEPCQGSLKVLGQDNRNTSINRIRSLFSVVSQDPFVFEGSIQQNIDPNNSYNSIDIIRILSKYGLSQIKLLENLQFRVQPHGSNLSLGEKQLLVLCRILLQKRKIVILDECTGNLDNQYCQQINLTLDLFMKDKTVIAITHKLDLLDMFDQLMIMDKGKIIACGLKQEILDQNSVLDDQLILQNKNIPHTPELLNGKHYKRQSQRIGLQSQISRNYRSKLSTEIQSQQRKTNNSSQKNKQNNLFQEYQDIFLSEYSESDSSQDLSQKISSVYQKRVSIQNYDKVIDEQMEFIHKTLHQKLSQIRKQKATPFLKSSQNNQMKQTIKSRKSIKQLSQLSKKNSFQNILHKSTNFNRERSIQISNNKNYNTQEQKSLEKILDQVGIPEQEKYKYKQIIEDLENQCLEIKPTGRNKIKQKVRKTFIQLFYQYYQEDNLLKGVDGDQISVYSGAQNESIIYGNKVYEPQNIQNNNMTQILDNVFLKNQNNGLISDRMKFLMDNFKLELSNEDSNFIVQSDQSSKIEIDEDDNEENEKQITQIVQDPTGQQDHLILKYERKLKRDPIYDPYPLIWQSKSDYLWILQDYQYYWDNYPLVSLRKIIVFIIRLITNTANKIINHRIFTIMVLISIIFNIVVFIQSQSDNLTIDIQIKLQKQQKIILFFFILENILKLIGQGIIDFFWDLQNVFDIIILILFSFHYYYPTLIIIDFSTARLLKILSVISVFSKRLQIMLLALKHSLKFLLEALIIVIIFSYFFALFGMHLFQGLFRYKCYYAESGIQTNQICGYNLSCQNQSMICSKSLTNPNVPTNFDDIFYSYVEVVRLMIFNEWTEPIYLSMQTFHDFSIVYFIFLIFIIAIFGANLIIAVLKIYYSQTLIKYQHQDIQELSGINTDIVLNFRIIKNYLIDYEWKNNRKKDWLIQTSNQQEHQTAIAKTIMQNNNQKNINYKYKYLSARQTKEQEEIKNRKRGIKQNISKLENFIDNFKFEKLLLFEQNKEQFMSKIYQNYAFDKEYLKLFYIQTFKKVPLYSWRTVIKQYFQYNSTSECDIFCFQIKNEKLQQKREREFEFIKKSVLSHCFKIKKSDYSFVKLDLKPKNSFQCFRLPIKQKKLQVQKSNINEKEQKIVQNNQNDLEDNKIITNNQISKRTFKSDDNIYDKEFIQQMINRQIPECLDKIQDFEELYVKYRLEECKQRVVYKNNWSGNNVLITKQKYQQTLKIFNQLNNIDIYKWKIPNLSCIWCLIQKNVNILLRNRNAQIFFDLIVLTNVLLLGMIGYVDKNIIRQLNDYLVFILISEQFLRLIFQGINRYCKRANNLIDIFILTCSLIQSLYLSLNSQNENIYLDLLNSSQTLLIYRIIKYNNFALKIAKITKKSLPSFLNLILLMITLIFCFAFVGMNLYKGKFPIDTDFGLQQSFDDLTAAFVTVFVRAANEDWFGMVILGSQYSNKIGTMFFSVISVYVLNLMTIGFILAIVLDSFSSYENDEEELIDEFADSQLSFLKSNENINDLTLNIDKLSSSQSDNNEKNSNQNNSYYQDKKQEIEKVFMKRNNNNFFDLVARINLLLEQLFAQFQFFTNNESQNSLFIFSQSNQFRKLCYRCINYKLYIKLIQITFLIALLNMCIYTYFDYENKIHQDLINKISNKVELIVNILLLLDSTLKIISLGFMRDKGAFINEFWRLCYISNFIVEYEAFQYLKALKYTRPFRFLYLFEQLKYINSAISKSLVDLMNILFVQIMVWLIFAIFGVMLYKDKMSYCQHPLNFGINKQECLEQGEQWINNLYNFDDMGNAMLSLYRMTACDDWVYIMQICLNSRGEDQGPILYDNRWVTIIYFMLFILVGVLFFLGFFAGILFINFQTYKSQLQKQILTNDQQLFANISKIIQKEVPNYSDPPKSFIRRLASNIIKENLYERMILLIIFINTGILTFFYDEAQLDLLQNLEDIYHTLSCLLIIDTGLKILAFGIRRYWGYIWREIEFILSFIALIDLTLYLTINWSKYYFKSTINDQYFLILRIAFACRNLRTLLIIQQFKGLTRLLRILNFSASFLLQILCFFFSILLFYGLIGCEYFGMIEKGAYMTDYMNFSNIGKALLILFKICTKNNWIRIMIDVSEHNQYCTSETQIFCGVKWIYANIYFYTFVLISNFVAFNLFITALVDQFEKFFNSQNSVLQTYIENIDPFRTTWCKYSTETKGAQMHSKHLAHFLLELGPPLGSAIHDNIWDAAKNASNFKIKADLNGYIHFQEVLYETIRFAYRDQIFRNGHPEGIKIIKQIDKDTRFRLHFKRLDILDRRYPIYQMMHLKGNFNILQEYLFLLMIFRTFRAYSVKTIGKIKEAILSPDITNQLKDTDRESSKSDINEDTLNRDILIETQHQISQNSEDVETFQIQISKYYESHNKLNKKLQFMDQSSNIYSENQLLFIPDSNKDDHIQFVPTKHKSSIKKKQENNFVDFEAIEQQQFHNPMFDSSQFNEISKGVMTDSSINDEQKIYQINQLIQSPHRFSMHSMSESVGTENHHFFYGKTNMDKAIN
ncbi:unnamed protein product [Paramecium sonneborni]|uniref:ABC transporter family protein n=1 Tax=Paramecium sonneborni TaxID=65129 RepID=A0A8S1QVC8_9CILI|nr:unnamed protein product [Paramecium sonneborni]